MFSGKIKCGECGASFVSRKKTRKDGSLYKRWSCYTATSEGQKRIDVRGNEVGCDVGKLLRDELALDILQQSLTTLRMDRDRIIQNVTALALEAIQMCEEGSTDRVEALEYEISQLKQKKADVLDAFFSKQITKEEMRPSVIPCHTPRPRGCLQISVLGGHSETCADFPAQKPMWAVRWLTL